MKYTHDELLNDLALAKRSIYKECPLGSPYMQIRVPIADLITFRPSYTRFWVDIFEVKASRSDFQSDIRTGKWEKYMRFCNRFYFAVADGVCEKDEVPESVGLYIRNEKGWRCVKQAKNRIVEPDLFMLKSMIFYRQKPNGNVVKRNNFAMFNYPTSRFKKRLKVIGKSFGKFITSCEDFY